MKFKDCSLERTSFSEDVRKKFSMFEFFLHIAMKKLVRYLYSLYDNSYLIFSKLQLTKESKYFILLLVALILESQVDDISIDYNSN